MTLPYKFNPKTNDIDDHYGPTASYAAGLILLLFWGYLMNAKLIPEWYGAVATITVELIVLCSVLQLR